jgi:excisionase family DNA binding protein
MKPNEGDRLLTVKEVCDRLSLSRATGYRHVANGTIPAVRIGGAWRVDPDALDAYLRAQAVKTRGSN